MKVLCECCLKETTVMQIDSGIGRYDYGGAIGYDSKVEYVTSCCECSEVISCENVELTRRYMNKYGWSDRLIDIGSTKWKAKEYYE